jgi:hypothetical protein
MTLDHPSAAPRRLAPLLAMAIVPASISGCAAYGTQTWRAPGDPSAPVLKITGTQSAFGATTISINDQLVMSGDISVFSGEGEMSGDWQGAPVLAKCKRSRSSKARTQCALTIDGRKAGTLYLRVD